MYWINDTTYGRIPEPDKEFRLVDEYIDRKITVNKYGFYDAGMRMVKPEGYYRIAVLGGKLESGHFNNCSFTWTDKCRELFINSRCRVDMQNFSLDLMPNDYNNILILRNKVLQFSPDLVVLRAEIPFIQAKRIREEYRGYIVEYERNNPGEEIRIKSEIDSILNMKPFLVLFNASYIVRGICRKIHERGNSIKVYTGIQDLINKYNSRFICSDSSVYSFTMEESVSILNDLNRSLTENGIALCIISNDYDQVKGLSPEISIINSDIFRDKSEYLTCTPYKYKVKDSEEIAAFMFRVLSDEYVPAKYISPGPENLYGIN